MYELIIFFNQIDWYGENRNQDDDILLGEGIALQIIDRWLGTNFDTVFIYSQRRLDVEQVRDQRR